ncbi:MAG: methyltransferase family protein [Endomicrobiales bacterium]
MFKYCYLLFVLAAIFNKAFITAKIHGIDKVKGTITHQWVTKWMYRFYFVPFFLPPVEFLLMKRTLNYYVSLSAFLAYAAGWLLSLWAIRTMGRYWTVEIEIRDEHPLIKKGPYRYLRHPHYLFILAELFCLPLVANAYYSLLLTAVLFIPVMSLRIAFEEKEMVRKFGARYEQYRKEVWGLFPVPILKKGVRE